MVSSGVPGSLTLAHYGNTAGNGFHNWMILREAPGVRQHPVVSYSDHCLASAAWEVMDFAPPEQRFFEHPDWTIVPGATELHAACLDRQYLSGVVPTNTRDAIFRYIRNVVFRTFVAKASQPEERFPTWILPRDVHRLADVHVFYGFPIRQVRRPPRGRLIALEHGTVRWIAAGLPGDAKMRQSYRTWLSRVDHLWVTNLDDATLDLADEICPGRWSALPHPYFLDAAAPYSEDPVLRADLCARTNSSFLLFLPSSINWNSDHDKGTLTALEAFFELRHRGHDVGLVCVRWGRQVGEAQDLLRRRGVQDNVAWLDPMPRVALQRTFAAVDVVLDQFRLEAFGGIAFKAMEQGVPLISRGITQRAASIIGSRPPYLEASTPDEVVAHVERLVESTATKGRPDTIRRYGHGLRRWFLDHHHHRITRDIQIARYRTLVEGADYSSGRNWAALAGSTPPGRAD